MRFRGWLLRKILACLGWKPAAFGSDAMLPIISRCAFMWPAVRALKSDWWSESRAPDSFVRSRLAAAPACGNGAGARSGQGRPAQHTQAWVSGPGGAQLPASCARPSR